MSNKALIGLGALGILGYVAYTIYSGSAEETPQHIGGGYMLMQRTQGVPYGQAPPTYNINFEAPELPSNIILQPEKIKKEYKAPRKHYSKRSSIHRIIEQAGYSDRAISTKEGVIVPDSRGGYIEYSETKKQSRYVSPEEAVAEAHKAIMFGGLSTQQTKKEDNSKELAKDLAISAVLGGSPIGFLISKLF